MEKLVQLFQALSEETRLRIVMLLTQGELCVCDLMAILREPQSKVSRHLSYLRNCGIAKKRRVGVWMHYSLMEPLDGGYRAQLSFLKEQFSSLPQFRRDMEKMLELKRQGGCRAMIASKSPDLFRSQPRVMKQALPS